jgi:hypothetical protein
MSSAHVMTIEPMMSQMMMRSMMCLEFDALLQMQCESVDACTLLADDML